MVLFRNQKSKNQTKKAAKQLISLYIVTYSCTIVYTYVYQGYIEYSVI